MSTQKPPANPPLQRKFNTVEEGAQAKADYVVHTVLKDFEWDKFLVKKQGPAK